MSLSSFTSFQMEEYNNRSKLTNPYYTYFCTTGTCTTLKGDDHVPFEQWNFLLFFSLPNKQITNILYRIFHANMHELNRNTIVLLSTSACDSFDWIDFIDVQCVCSESSTNKLKFNPDPQLLSGFENLSTEIETYW